MSFPESPRVIFQKNPLVDVICQLRYPTILEIRVQEPAAFQNEIRADYPIYKTEDASGLIPNEITQLVGQLGLPMQAGATTHKFLSEDQSRAITLTSDFVAINDEHYERWEKFSLEVERARLAVEHAYQPAFYTRIGLRYRNIIDREKLGLEDPWVDLVNPYLISLLGAEALRDDVDEIKTETLLRVGQVDDGFVRLFHGLVKSAEDGHIQYRIDADYFTQHRSSGEDVTATSEVFHRLGGNLFRWATTARLQHAMEPVEIE